MWNIPNKERLNKIPRLYETEQTPAKNKLIYLHFFIGGSDWYIAEYDGEDLFFGFAILNNNYQNAEWGYISFTELKEIKVDNWLEIDCELEEFFPVQKAIEIEKIREAQGWENEIEDKKNIGVDEKEVVNQVLVTVSGGIIDHVEFFDDPKAGIETLEKFVKGMNVENDDAALYDSNGLVANAKHFLNSNDECIGNQPLVDEISVERKEGMLSEPFRN